MKNIIVAFIDHSAAQKIRTILTCSGFSVAGVCTSGAQVISLSRRLQDGGVVICSSKFNDMNTEFLAGQITSDYDFLLLLHSHEVVMEEGKNIYSLQLPLKKSDLLDSVRMLLTTGSFKLDRNKTAKSPTETKREDRAERTREDKECIERAKGVLMERNGLTEEQAHRFLQKRSMDNGRKLIDTAIAILEGW